LGSSARVCELCGSASRTRSANGSSRSTGPESRVIPTCAPSWPTPSARDWKDSGVGRMGRGQLMEAVRDRCPCRCHTSMSSAAASPARISPTPEPERGSTGSARVFGPSTPDSFANFDRDTSSWRTSQLSLLEDSGVFSETWPRAGMTRNGTAFRLRPLAPLTGGTGSGLLPTPTVVAERLPTPTAGDAKSARNATAGRRDPDSKHHAGTTLSDVAYQAGGSLNPTWVEWLMGFPLGWTDLEA
jgi:hypothetical protein